MPLYAYTLLLSGTTCVSTARVNEELPSEHLIY